MTSATTSKQKSKSKQSSSTMKRTEDDDKMGHKTWKIKVKLPHLASLILLFLVAVILVLTKNNGNIVLPDNPFFLEDWPTSKKRASVDHQVCNLFSGRWVFDNISHPLYKERDCSFISTEFACERYGRKDLKYQNWRWQPHGCDLPRFNGTALLEKLRGKKLVYVGDSLCRNQWQSMLCMIDSSLPPSSNRTVILKGNLYSFHSTDYNATICLYWDPMLVESNGDDVNHHNVRPRVVRIHSIEKHGREWLDADILVFDSFAWWMDQTIIMLWGSFGSPDAIYQPVHNKLRHYEMALHTWSDWVEMQINRTKTQLFFMGFSPYHMGHGGTRTVFTCDSFCYGKTEPIHYETYWVDGMHPKRMRIVESVIGNLGKRGVKVEYLNITQLSGYREDAHPSIYRSYWGNVDQNKSKEKDPNKYADCLHWCLPGVPDVWNQILYYHIIRSESK